MLCCGLACQDALSFSTGCSQTGSSADTCCGWKNIKEPHCNVAGTGLDFEIPSFSKYEANTDKSKMRQEKKVGIYIVKMKNCVYPQLMFLLYFENSCGCPLVVTWWLSPASHFSLMYLASVFPLDLCWFVCISFLSFVCVCSPDVALLGLCCALWVHSLCPCWFCVGLFFVFSVFFFWTQVWPGTFWFPVAFFVLALSP